jgi:hypothetical protein
MNKDVIVFALHVVLVPVQVLVRYCTCAED